jgi:hypothetical protein
MRRAGGGEAPQFEVPQRQTVRLAQLVAFLASQFELKYATMWVGTTGVHRSEALARKDRIFGAMATARLGRE